MAGPLLLNQFDRTARWMKRGGRENDIVLSSRVRLARNLRRYEFPHHASSHDLMAIRQRAITALERTAEFAPAKLFLVPFEEFTGWERQSLIDRHLTSREHVKDELGRAVAATADGSLSILINEEDHIRLQSLLPGLQFEAAHALVDKMDDTLEAWFDQRSGGVYAYDEQFGYLTACPTNAGTGMRASAMLHLPALEITGHIDKARKWCEGQQFTLRGTFGEGSKVWGHLHQLSNEVTLGLDEAAIVANMEAAVLSLCEQERAARELLPTRYAVETRDCIGRAYGTLRYAHTISCREATDCLSWLRLGQEIGWTRGLTRQHLCELLVWIRPAYLQVLHGRSIAGAERDTIRASLLRPHVGRVKFESAFAGIPPFAPESDAA